MTDPRLAAIAEVVEWLRAWPREQTPSYWAIADAIEREFLKDDDERN